MPRSMDRAMDDRTHLRHPTSDRAVRTAAIAFIQVATQRRMIQKGHGGLQNYSTSLSIPRSSAQPPRFASSWSQSTLSKPCPPPGLTGIAVCPPNHKAVGSTLDPASAPFNPLRRPALLPSPPSNTSLQPHDQEVCSPNDGPDDAAGSNRSKLHPETVAQPCQAPCGRPPSNGPDSVPGSCAVVLTDEKIGGTSEASTSDSRDRNQCDPSISARATRKTEKVALPCRSPCGVPPPSGPDSVPGSCAVALTDEKIGRTSEASTSDFRDRNQRDPSKSARATRKPLQGSRYKDLFADRYPNGTFVSKGRDGRCGRPGVYGEADEMVWHRPGGVRP